MNSLLPQPGSVRHLRDIREIGREAGWTGVVAVLASGSWALFLGLLWLNRLQLPRSAYLFALMVAPLAFTGAAVVWREERVQRVWTVLAAVAALGSGAILGAQLTALGPTLVFIVIGFLLTLIIVKRLPTATVVVLFLISGTYGTLLAYANVHAGIIVTVLLTALSLTTLASRVWNRTGDTRFPIGVLLVAAYLAVSVLEIFIGPDPLVSVRQFLVSGWFMLGFIAIAYRDWTRQQLHRLAGAILIISTGVGAYATLRWLTGPTGAENKLLQNAGDYANTINATGGNRVIGSFPNGPALGFWAATALPFCLALVLFGSRRMRWAALGLPLLVVGVLGSGSRASLVSAGVGTLLVLALALFARAEPRQQVTVVGGAMLVMAVFGGFLFSRVVADNPAKVARYANILTPGNDASFAGRIDKWTAVVTAVDTHPIGFGIGTASPGGPRIRFPSKAADNVDSAYMQVAYEQGIPVMVLYIVALLVLLVGLARRGRVARDRFHAGLQIGAAGAFVAFIIVCVAGQFQFDLIATGVWIMAALGVAVGLRSPSAIPDSLPAAERTRVPEPVA